MEEDHNENRALLIDSEELATRSVFIRRKGEWN